MALFTALLVLNEYQELAGTEFLSEPFQERNMQNDRPSNNNDLLLQELKKLDTQLVQVNNEWLKPSQCYYYETDPAHILFNTNCPDELKSRIESLLAKYAGSGAQQ